MNDMSAQDPQTPSSSAPVTSYLDDYLPPLPPAHTPAPANASPSDVFATPADSYLPPLPKAEPTADSMLGGPFSAPPRPVAQPSTTPAPQPTMAPPIASATLADDSLSTAPGNPGESLEDQNIFDLLGVTDGTDQEKERFLDELQQVIWEDFLENDVKLLLTTQELTELEALTKAEGGNDLEKQEKIVVYLEKLIPDLEEIMLEKALELKGDLVKERIAGMKEYFAQNQAALQTLTQAEEKINDSQWRTAAAMLNSLKQ